MANPNGEQPILIGVIGGSGLYHMDNLHFIKHVNPETPWGHPSAPITIAALPSGVQVAFLARHGSGHAISPSVVPARANIAALKSLGVRAILAFSAVGSLREEISPGSFVLPTQIIDRTKGIRPASFFEGLSVVAHAAFGDPFSHKLVQWLEGRVRKVLEEDGKGVKLFTDKTIVCMEGPQFSTRAESIMYRQWGGDLINMSVLPEAKLAREAEISYALIATATDYDAWRPHSDAVTAAEVLKTLQANADTSRLVAAAILEGLHSTVSDDGGNHGSVSGDGEDLFLEEVGSMKFSIMPRSVKQKPEDRKRLAGRRSMRCLCMCYRVSAAGTRPLLTNTDVVLIGLRYANDIVHI
ncbi:S-methyl-5'-thioadenosine phosphorylase [Hypsizygus marmoreus]|uniref:S-methyl-5'-thioadenosine phosphorylase n=1 Tax=Hypsizygus marmoreus TaxID=39966 RepID=A0A369K725_HYPMA|nr:S-methyl-5'-thioadenosine phosphorylase [Hypsizygus marmoreus]